MRRLLPAVLLLAAAVVACGNDEQGSEAGPVAPGFPVSVAHKYGAAEIPDKPTRVVVVGLVEQDALLALEVVPLATTEWFGEKPGAIFPWAEKKLGGAAKPQVLKNTDGLQFERIAALDPDLIVGLYSELSQADYDKLKVIAPTIAPPAGVPNYGVAWQDVTRTVGKAVGKADQAEKLVTDIEARFAKIRAEHPEFKGRTALMATPWEGYFIYGSQDPRTRVLSALGFRLPANLDKLVGDKFGGNISKERMDVLDTDVLVWFVEPGQSNKLKNDPLYKGFQVRKQGRDIFVDADNDDAFYGATAFVSALSLPIVLDALPPRLEAALDGNPATT